MCFVLAAVFTEWTAFTEAILPKDCGALSALILWSPGTAALVFATFLRTADRCPAEVLFCDGLLLSTKTSDIEGPSDAVETVKPDESTEVCRLDRDVATLLDSAVVACIRGSLPWFFF